MKDYLKIGAIVLILGVIAFVVEFSLSSSRGKAGNVDIDIYYSPAFTEAGAPPANWKVYDIVSDKLGINLNLTPLPASSVEQDKIIMAAADEDRLPDFFSVSGTSLNYLMSKNMLAPVDELYDLMPHRSPKMYPEESRGLYMSNGKHYALTQAGSITKNEGVLIRKDWLDKLGLPVPVTTSDFLRVMRAFTNGDPDGDGRKNTYGFGAFIETKKNEEGLGTRFQPIFGAFGVEGTMNLTKKNAGLNIYKPEYYDALEYIRQIVSEKVIDPNWTVYSKTDFRDAWKRGAFGIMREQNAALALENNYSAFDEKFPNGEWIVINPPVGPKGNSSVGIYSNQGHRLFAISKKAYETGKIRKLVQLLDWMSTDEGYLLLGFGIKGINYNLDINGYVTTEGLADQKNAYTKKEVAPYLQLRNLVFYNSDMELVGKYPEWKTRNGRKISALKYLREMQEKKWTANFGSEGIPTPSNALKEFYEQGVLDFVTGQRHLSRQNWNEWLKEFDAKGGKDWERACIEYAVKNDLLTD